MLYCTITAGVELKLQVVPFNLHFQGSKVGEGARLTESYSSSFWGVLESTNTAITPHCGPVIVFQKCGSTVSGFFETLTMISIQGPWIASECRVSRNDGKYSGSGQGLSY